MAPGFVAPPHFRGHEILGNSQGLRFLLARGILPDDLEKFPRTLGLCRTGMTVAGLIDLLNEQVPNKSLVNPIVFIGTNDLLALCSAVEWKKRMKKALRGKFGTLRCVLASKCREDGRAIILTIPPLPRLLLNESGCGMEVDQDEARYLWGFINSGLKELSTPFIHVVEIIPYLMRDGVVLEEMFEDVMGQKHNRREDRIHINKPGMDAVISAIESLPPK